MSTTTPNDDDIQKHLATLKDYLERSTHWQEGGATRHDALKLAFPALAEWIGSLKIGLEYLRTEAKTNARQAEAARATARTAIEHLQAVLNKARTFDEQQKADTAARDWLISIGSEPS